MQIVVKNPHTEVLEQLSVGTPSITQVEDLRGYPDISEYCMSLSGSYNPATGDSRVLRSEIFMGDIQNDLIYGGELVPPSVLRGCETRLAADITDVATTMTITHSTKQWPGLETENILVAGQPYLLMHQRPSIGVSIWDTGTVNGFLAPDAEIITIDGGYVSGTTVTIARTFNGTARKKGAYIQPLTGAFVPYNKGYSGIVIPAERPKILTMGAQTSTVADTIDAFWVESPEEASTLATGVGGSVTGYGIWIFPKAGAYLNNLNAGIPDNAQPSQYDDTGQVDAIFAIGSAKIEEATVLTVVYKTVEGLNRCWNPVTNALEVLVTGLQYWVVVRALTSTTLDYTCRMSPPAIALSAVVL